MMTLKDIDNIIQAEIHSTDDAKVLIISLDHYLRPDLLDEMRDSIKAKIPNWTVAIFQGGAKFKVVDDIHAKKQKS